MGEPVEVDFGNDPAAWGAAPRAARWPAAGAELSPELRRIVENFDPAQPRGEDGRWVTLDGGQHVFVGPDGGFRPHGPGTGSATPKAGHVIGGVRVTPPPPPAHGADVHAPDPAADHDGDGVADAARVGVPAMAVPPPPPIGRLPNLTPHERAVEKAFIDHYEADPDGVAGGFRDVVHKTTPPGEPPVFGTDDAKVLAAPWTVPDPETRAENRATLNLALHQTANAIAKRAFLQELDALEPGDQVMVTCGGCGAGKGFGLETDPATGQPRLPAAFAVKAASKVVWDSAGDQNATENVWVQREAERRGLRVAYVYTHANPYDQWADPKRGVVQRAASPKNGRMVDAHVFADSYALGARNFDAFRRANADNPSATFTFVDNTGPTPRLLPGMPKEDLHIDRDDLLRFAVKTVKERDVPFRVKLGATAGDRIWGHDESWGE